MNRMAKLVSVLRCRQGQRELGYGRLALVALFLMSLASGCATGPRKAEPDAAARLRAERAAAKRVSVFIVGASRYQSGGAVTRVLPQMLKHCGWTVERTDMALMYDIAAIMPGAPPKPNHQAKQFQAYIEDPKPIDWLVFTVKPAGPKPEDIARLVPDVEAFIDYVRAHHPETRFLMACGGWMEAHDELMRRRPYLGVIAWYAAYNVITTEHPDWAVDMVPKTKDNPGDAHPGYLSAYVASAMMCAAITGQRFDGRGFVFQTPGEAKLRPGEHPRSTTPEETAYLDEVAWRVRNTVQAGLAAGKALTQIYPRLTHGITANRENP